MVFFFLLVFFVFRSIYLNIHFPRTWHYFYNLIMVMAGMRRQSLTFYKRLQERVQGQSALHLCKFEIHRGHLCINYGPYCTLWKNILIYHYCVNLHKVHHIINIEVSLLFIAHTKQYHACRQVLSILSAVRSTHVLISRCNSMATDLEIISLSSRQECLTLLPQ